MKILPSTMEDIPVIRELFRAAIRYQQLKFGKHWEELNEPMLMGEIGDRLHWKVVDGEDRIAAFVSIAFTDELVWDERDADPAIYLHRIVTNPDFRGRGYARVITAWAEEYGKAAGMQFVRLDTDVENERLNAYYRECGYVLCGIKQFNDLNDLRVPRHYFGAGLSLFERRIPGC